MSDSTFSGLSASEKVLVSFGSASLIKDKIDCSIVFSLISSRGSTTSLSFTLMSASAESFCSKSSLFTEVKLSDVIKSNNMLRSVVCAAVTYKT